MKRLIIICEGQTEKEFCNDVLRPYFFTKGYHLETPLIKQTKGGIVPWNILKEQIEKHLIQDTSSFVTTFIDFYGINEKHNFPNWEHSKSIPYKEKRIETIENAMKDEISDAMRYRFIPYIQLHEFEALLFSDTSVFDNNFDQNEFQDYAYMLKTIADFDNPEMINDSRLTAPSKRLARIIGSNYSKVVYGSMLAAEIGLEKIRSKCSRFNDWITSLEY
jgi:Domain of unknown function (DUF4276)